MNEAKISAFIQQLAYILNNIVTEVTNADSNIMLLVSTTEIILNGIHYDVTLLDSTLHNNRELAGNCANLMAINLPIINPIVGGVNYFDEAQYLFCVYLVDQNQQKITKNINLINQNPRSLLDAVIDCLILN